MPQVLYEEVVEVEERITLHKDECCLKRSCPVVRASTGEDVSSNRFLLVSSARHTIILDFVMPGNKSVLGFPAFSIHFPHWFFGFGI